MSIKSPDDVGSVRDIQWLSLCGMNGGRGRDRTYDQSIKSRMLYQLSYASFWFLLLEEASESLFARVPARRLQSCDYLKISQLAA